MITSQIFGLVLTACSSAVNIPCSSVEPTTCSINAQGEVTGCEDHVIDVSYRESVCYTQLEKETPNLLELETLSCQQLKELEY